LDTNVAAARFAEGDLAAFVYARAEATLTRIVNRRNWLVLGLACAIGLSLLISFPRLSFFTGKDSQIVNFWPAIEHQSQNLLSMEGVDSQDLSSHFSKRAFRMTLPAIMRLLDAHWITVLALQYIVGVLLLYLVGRIAYDLFKCPIAATATLFGIAFICAGKAAFLQLGGMGDPFAYAFIIAALAFRTPAVIVACVFAACFTDERAYVAAPLVGIYWALREDRINFLNKATLAVGIAIAFAISVRLFLQTAYGLHVPVGAGTDAGLGMLPKTLPGLQFALPRAFAGLWLWPIVGLLYLVRDKRWLTVLAICVPAMALIFVSHLVIDTDRSLAYLLPVIFVGMAAVRRYEPSLSGIKKLAIWAMLLTLLIPANNLFSGDSKYSPGNFFLVELVRLAQFMQQ
jgi:hypothetical protein